MSRKGPAPKKGSWCGSPLTPEPIRCLIMCCRLFWVWRSASGCRRLSAKPTNCMRRLVEAEAQRRRFRPLAKARAFRLKCIKQILDSRPLLDEQLMELARWISEYYVCPLGQTLAAMVPAAVRMQASKERRVYLRMAAPAEILKSKPQSAGRCAARPAPWMRAAPYRRDALLADAGCTDGAAQAIGAKANR